MNTLITTDQAFLVIAAYAVLMLTAVWLTIKTEKDHKDNYFIADRKLGVFRAAASTAVSWIWAPAIFFAGLKAYDQGIAGAFWFIIPNILCFGTFAVVVNKMRQQHDDFYTLPDYLLKRFNNNASAHTASLTVVSIIDLVALLFNSFVGAFLLKMLTGIELFEGIGIMMLIAVTYSVWRGFPASVITDVIQLTTIIAIAFLIVPWLIFSTGSEASIINGLAGAQGNIDSIFDSDVLYSFGIPATIALLAVPLADQMFYQRAAAIPRKKIIKTFLFAGVMFGIVPLLLSLPGFIGATLSLNGELEQSGLPSLFISIDVVAQYLPSWVLIVFAVLAICALSSTIDSALVSLGFIWGQDVYGRYINPKATDQQVVNSTRASIVAIAAITYLIAWLLQDYLSGDVLFNFNGAIASTLVGPLLFVVFSRMITPKAMVWSIIIGLLVAIPSALWANYGYHVQGDSSMADEVLLVAVGIPLLTTILAITLSKVPQLKS